MKSKKSYVSNNKVVITGASGFTAAFLYKFLLLDTNPNQIYCISRSNLSYPNSYVCDLTNFRETRKIIKEICPSKIYNLAGSFTNDYKTDYNVNVLIAKNILDALVKENIPSRVLFIGSAAEYGKIKDKDNPISENQSLNPVTIHGLTKAYQMYLMKCYHYTHGVDVVMARTFNLFGEGMSTRLFVGTVYDQIQRYKKGEISKITVGNLENMRDYIDIFDAVKYYKTIMDYGMSGEVYNVGSGKAVKLSVLMRRILKQNKLSMNVVKTFINATDKKYDATKVYADISKLKSLQK